MVVKSVWSEKNWVKVGTYGPPYASVKRCSASVKRFIDVLQVGVAFEDGVR